MNYFCCYALICIFLTLYCHDNISISNRIFHTVDRTSLFVFVFLISEHDKMLRELESCIQLTIFVNPCFSVNYIIYYFLLDAQFIPKPVPLKCRSAQMWFTKAKIQLSDHGTSAWGLLFSLTVNEKSFLLLQFALLGKQEVSVK